MDLVTKQREERKERILEVARRQIADRGFEGITMRELADESLVSVPTLYNLFGGKNELLFAAVESFLRELLMHRSSDVPETEGLDKLIAIVEQVSAGTLMHPAYARSMTGFIGASGNIGGLHEFVTGELIRAVVTALDEMQRKRQLVAWANVQVAGERLAGVLTITIIDWAFSRLNDDALRAALFYSAGLVLLGLARGKAAPEVEKLVRDHQEAASALRPGPPVPSQSSGEGG